jgi:hypothetical protein
LTIFLILTFCGPTFSQTTAADARVVEKLPDGDFIVSIEGREYRAVSPDHARRLAKEKVELDALRAEKPQLEQKAVKLLELSENYKSDAAKAIEQRDSENARAEKFKQDYERERDLRLSAEKLKKPNTLEKLLGNPIVQSAIVIVSGAVVAVTAKR